MIHKKYIPRDLTNSIINHLDKEEITVLIGARQVGKTTLLMHLKEYLIAKGCKESEISFFNLDLVADRRLFESQEDFILYLKSRIGKNKIYVFIDEVQRLEEPGLFLKGIYDLKLPVKLIISGSSSLEIKAKINEPLTGRKRVFHLYPFSFHEYLKAKNSTLAKIVYNKKISSFDQKNIMNCLFDYLNYGGYPKVVLENNNEEKEKILEELYSSYIEKDIIAFLRIKNSSSFMKLVKILASQIGNLLNVYEISQTLGIERKTVDNYLDILEKTFVVKKIPPYFKNARKELTKMPKVYFFDTGLRNYAIYSFKKYFDREDKGQLLENFIFSELQREYKINYWRTKLKAEVDFVLQKVDGTIIPVEAKASLLKSPEISRSFRSFLIHYKTSQAYIINLGLKSEDMFEGTKVKFILPYEKL